MDSTSEGREAAAALLGQQLEIVLYVGLKSEEPERWDYGDWHWPEVGVQFTTTAGERFYATWTQEAAEMVLAFVQGPMGDRWLSESRVWDVSGHPGWTPLVNSPITSCRIAVDTPDDLFTSTPVAMRIGTDTGVAWLVAAAPTDQHRAHASLHFDDVIVGHDEVIVLFDDREANSLGLRAIH